MNRRPRVKRLTLVRHAKSSWKDPSRADFDRPLNKRGKQDAPKMGKRLADRDFIPDVIVTSPAKRAWKTARAIAEEIDYPVDEIEREDRIYEAGLPTLVDLVRSFDDSLEHVMIVGHNPGFTELANWSGEKGIHNLPTCAVLCMDWDVASWRELEPCGGISLFLDYPKKSYE
jgi:phosphohistidine phosphatase